MARKNYSKIKANKVEPRKPLTLLWLFLIIAVLWFLYIDTPNSVLYAKSGFLRWLPFALIFAVLPYLLLKFINAVWKHNSGWSIVIAIGSVFVVGPTFGIVSERKQHAELRKNGVLTKGIVIEKFETFGKGYNGWNVVCKYDANGKAFTTFTIPDRENAFDLGDTLNVVYSSLNPENAEVLELSDFKL